MSAALEISDLRVVLGGRDILRRVQFSARPGETIALLGGSGTGKSVTLKAILGLLPATAGSVRIDGVDVLAEPAARASEARARIGMLFQGGALFDSLSIWENIGFRLLHAEGFSRAQSRDQALEMLDAVGLDRALAERRPADLSGGQQKRAGLARALAAEPEVLFFDEPTTGLDPLSAGRIDALMAETVDRTGATAVMITHDLASVRRVCQRVAFLWEGEIGWEGPVDQLDDSGFEPLQAFPAGARLMARARSHYVCQDCGASHSRWSGKCEQCGGWNTLVEEAINTGTPGGLGKKGGGSGFGSGGSGGGGRGRGDGLALNLVELTGAAEPPPRLSTGDAELDRVTGGGLVPGSALLIGGDPGIGKSTLLLQTAASLRAVAKATGALRCRWPMSAARNRSIRCGCALNGWKPPMRRSNWLPGPPFAIS